MFYLFGKISDRKIYIRLMSRRWNRLNWYGWKIFIPLIKCVFPWFSQNFGYFIFFSRMSFVFNTLSSSPLFVPQNLIDFSIITDFRFSVNIRSVYWSTRYGTTPYKMSICWKTKLRRQWKISTPLSGRYNFEKSKYRLQI